MINYLLILIILFSLIHQSFLFPKQVENFININETINQNQSLFHKNKRNLQIAKKTLPPHLNFTIKSN